MKISRLMLVALSFAVVFLAHMLWDMYGQSSSPWRTLPSEQTRWSQYLASGKIWLGLSYGLAAAFAAYCLTQLYQYRKRAVAGAVGGLTLVGFLYAAGCFMLGCCGSPMLAVYVGLFGSRFAGFAKPLVFVITAISVGIGYILVTRKMAKAEACCQPCCGPAEISISQVTRQQSAAWITNKLNTAVGDIPQVDTSLKFSDRMGAFKARVGINRMHYAVDPRLYAVGNPTADSPVLVSANYKLSFDRLRTSLPGLDAWIMVLDTKGINVWCAAGKGTFGTEEIVNRVEATKLAQVVSHRTLILPQLSAPGVAAHQVKKLCGFRVVYGPVRAPDLPAFMEARMKATPQMRRISFTLPERLILTPIELVMGGKYLVVLCLALFFVAGLGRGGYSFDSVPVVGGLAVVLTLFGFLAGAVLTPALLPWLPGRAFSIKGALVGLAVGLVYAWFSLQNWSSLAGRLDLLAWLLILPALAAFFAMNFTGASTYTSLSGVKKEVRLALPVQITALVIGTGLWIASHFL